MTMMRFLPQELGEDASLCSAQVRTASLFIMPLSARIPQKGATADVVTPCTKGPIGFRHLQTIHQVLAGFLLFSTEDFPPE